MPGSVASSPHRTPEMIWTSPCRHSKWWGQSWDLSEPFWGRRGGSWLLGSGAYRAFRGYFLGDHFSLEVDGIVAQPLSQLSGVGKTNVVFGSASLVISSGSAYVLGGYSRLHMGPNPPYSSDLNAVHGGLGERIVFGGDRMALRVEARAYYRGPGGGLASHQWIGHFTGTMGLSFLLGGREKKSL